MGFINTNLKNTKKTSKTEESKYDFERQKDEALKEFDKLYANFKNNPDNKPPKEEKTKNQQNKEGKIKVKFKKNKMPNFTDIIFKDQDKTLLIILIIMLMDNEENMIIIMTLIYLLI